MPIKTQTKIAPCGHYRHYSMHMPTPARILHIFLRIVLALTIVSAGLVLATAFFLRQNPHALAEHLADAVRSRAGIECTMGLVDVAMLPVPALAVADIQIRTDDLIVSVAYATVRPSFMALLRGEFEPGDITLLRPEITFTPQERIFPTAAEAGTPFSIPPVVQNCRIIVQHGSLTVQEKGGREFRLRDIRTDISPAITQGKSSLHGWLHIGSATVYDGDTIAAYLDAIQVDVDGAVLDPAQRTGSVRIQGRGSLPHMVSVASLDIQVEQKKHGATTDHMVSANIQGTLPFDGQSIPFHVDGIGKNTDSGAFVIDGLSLGLDKDRIHMQGSLTLPQGETLWPQASGKLTIHRLSLVQWFGFGRPMPAGLQNTLDVLSGTLDFELDAKGLKVPRLQINVADTSFEGNGGVASWTNPLIAINARSRQISLNTALPESMGRSPKAPVYSHKALTPEPGSTDAASMSIPDISYDIQLQVDEVHYGPLRMQNAQYRCLPGGQGRVDMRFGVGGLYGGTADGALLLTSGTGTKPTHYNIRAQIKNMSVERPLHSLTGSKWLGGRLTASAQWVAEGKNPIAFLTSLSGTTALKVEDGYFDSPSQAGDADKFIFSRLECSSRTRGQSAGTTATRTTQPDALSFDGEWQGLLHSKDWQGSVRLDGPLSFTRKGGLPLFFQKIPGSVSVQLNKEVTGLTQTVKAHATGRYSFHTGTSSLEVEDANISAEGLEVRGTLHSTLKELTLKGDIQAKTEHLRRVLALTGTSFDTLPSGALQQAQCTARIALSPTSLSLSNMKAKVDATHVAGTVEGQWKERPAWKFDLNADSFDLATYRTPDPEGAKASTAAWNLKTLQSTDAQGTIRINTATLYRLRLQNVHIPVRLSKGLLECVPLKAELYTAPAKGSLRAEAKNGLHIRFDAQAFNVDMLPLTTDQNFGTVLAGRAVFNAYTEGTLRSDADIPVNLNGTYGLEIVNGYFQSRTPQGSAKGGKTAFTFVRGTGQLQKGILRNTDFVMDGSTMRVTGKGQIDFVTRQLDYTALVNMRNIAEFPVHYYGSLSNPQRDIKAGKAIVDTLGQLGTDAFGLVGDVLSVPFKLFR